MASDPLVTQLVGLAEALREAGRVQGRQEVSRDFFGQSAVRLTGGIFATALSAAASQMAQVSPQAARFFAAKAQEFQAFATPPSVTAVSPQTDARNVATTDQVVIRFAVPMDHSTLTAENVYVGPASGGSHIDATLTYDDASKSLTLAPAHELSPGVTYKITVTKRVESFSGQPMQTDFTSTFVTAG